MGKAISGCPGRSVDLSAGVCGVGNHEAGSGRPIPTEAITRFYNQPHRFYAGGDLHARTLYLHILDDQGRTRFEKNLVPNPETYRRCVATP